MKSVNDCTDITDIRAAIDEIDEAIVRLISDRAAYVNKASLYKKSEEAVKDADRVAMVLQSKRDLASAYGISPDLIESLYRVMIKHFISAEMDEWRAHNEEA